MNWSTLMIYSPQKKIYQQMKIVCNALMKSLGLEQGLNYSIYNAQTLTSST